MCSSVMYGIRDTGDARRWVVQKNKVSFLSFLITHISIKNESKQTSGTFYQPEKLFQYIESRLNFTADFYRQETQTNIFLPLFSLCQMLPW